MRDGVLTGLLFIVRMTAATMTPMSTFGSGPDVLAVGAAAITGKSLGLLLRLRRDRGTTKNCDLCAVSAAGDRT